MDRISGHVRSNIVGYVAVFLALTGSAAALQGRNSVTSNDIKRFNVKRADLAPNSVDSTKVRDGSLLGADFASGQLPQGATGPQGPTGPAGSADTPGQVLAKLKEVDGSGSGLDSDQLDGLDSTAFVAAKSVATRRMTIDDTMPGDGSGPSDDLVTDGVTVEGLCAQDYNASANERALVSLVVPQGGGGPISISAVPTSGPATEEAAVSTGLAVLDFSASGDVVNSVNFVTVAANGKVANGVVSVEVNDAQAPGSDCTFGVNVLSP